MTREVAIRRLLNIERSLPNTFRTKEDVRNFEALDMAIKALEQEPTDENLHREREQAYMQGYEDASKRFRQEPSSDAISRQATLAEFKRLYYDDKTVTRCAELVINNMPPVNPQEPKTGHWLYIDERKAKCSQCGYIQITGGADKTGHCNIHYGVYKYCTNCGAKMVEPQERSGE